MKVALLHNPRPERVPPGLPDDAFEEYDPPETIRAIAAALSGLAVAVEPVVADARLPWTLTQGAFDFVFNAAEGAGGRCREAVPAAVCELLAIPSTGPDALTLALCLDKAMARRAVWPDVPVASGVLVDGEPDASALEALAYPAIVKPNDEGSSKGIRDGQCLVSDAAAAAARCLALARRYGRPALVEEFLPGPEVTVGVAGSGREARVLGMMEIGPQDGSGPFVYTVEAKRDFRRRVRYHVPPRLPEAIRETLACRALAAYRLLGCRDIARLDFRCDASGQPRFLECNPLPGLDPERADIVILSRGVLPYERLVQGILADAARRTGVALP